MPAPSAPPPSPSLPRGRWLDRLGNAGARQNARSQLDLRRAEAQLVESLDQRLRRLGRAPRALPEPVLTDIARRVAAHETLWRAVVHHDEAERTPVRLIGTDRYEVWVIGWTPGQAVVLHDHGGSAGALLVVDGELQEEVATDGGLARHALRKGDGRELPVETVHAVGNVGTRPATSIHVYSPPLDSMTHFAEDTFLPVGSEVVDEEPPVLPSSIVPALLHPAALPITGRAS
jgi:hypothetical protein